MWSLQGGRPPEGHPALLKTQELKRYNEYKKTECFKVNLHDGFMIRSKASTLFE